MSRRFFAAAILAGVLSVAGCGSDDNSAVRKLAGPSSSSRQAAQIAPPALTVTSAPLPTVTPDLQPETVVQPAQIIETTRIVEVTRIMPATVQIIVTATPDVVGFEPAIDESVQPCPARFWKRGRCTATAAQIEAYANEVAR